METQILSGIDAYIDFRNLNTKWVNKYFDDFEEAWSFYEKIIPKSIISDFNKVEISNNWSKPFLVSYILK